MTTRQAYSGVARITIEEHLGRHLTSNECVHHVDEDITNNELSNLRLMSRSDHTSFHMLGNQKALDHTCPKEAKEKIAKLMLGNKRALGHKYIPTEDARERMSKAGLGNQRAAGTKRSQAEKDNISKKMKELRKEKFWSSKKES
jgi:hypothetical protein